MKEEWLNIIGYENYQISNLGNVKSLERYVKSKNNSFRKIETKILIKIKQGDYYIVNLYNNNKMKTFKIHQLMGELFLNHKTDGTTKLIIDHINNNSFDNRLSNLQIITHRENTSKDRINKNGFIGVSKIGKNFKAKYILMVKINI